LINRRPQAKTIIIGLEPKKIKEPKCMTTKGPKIAVPVIIQLRIEERFKAPYMSVKVSPAILKGYSIVSNIGPNINLKFSFTFCIVIVKKPFSSTICDAIFANLRVSSCFSFARISISFILISAIPSTTGVICSFAERGRLNNR